MYVHTFAAITGSCRQCQVAPALKDRPIGHNMCFRKIGVFCCFFSSFFANRLSYTQKIRQSCTCASVWSLMAVASQDGFTVRTFVNPI